MVNVRLAESWTDGEGNSHAAGDTVEVDAVTLAELQASGVAPDPDGDDAGTESWINPTGDDGGGTDGGTTPTGDDGGGADSWINPTGDDGGGADSWINPTGDDGGGADSWINPTGDDGDR